MSLNSTCCCPGVCNGVSAGLSVGSVLLIMYFYFSFTPMETNGEIIQIFFYDQIFATVFIGSTVKYSKYLISKST